MKCLMGTYAMMKWYWFTFLYQIMLCCVGWLSQLFNIKLTLKKSSRWVEFPWKDQ